MKDRLKQLRKFLRLTQGEFGEKIGMTDASVSHMESGRTALSKQNIRLICLVFGVREAWLESGEGEMLDDEALLSEREKRLLELFRRLSPKAQRMVIEYAEKLLDDEEAIRGGSPEAPKQAPGGTTSAQEGPQKAERQETTEKREAAG
jgi:transcriptional regulator with XRE-family HTH domain